MPDETKMNGYELAALAAVRSWNHEPTYRPEWDEWKRRLSYFYEREGSYQNANRPPEPRDGGYVRMGGIVALSGFPPPLVTLGKSSMRQRLAKYEPADDEKELHAWLIRFYDEWTPIGAKLAEIKSELIAGRRPSAEQQQRERFLADPVTQAARKLIADRVAEITAPWKAEEAVRIKERLMKTAETYSKERKDGESIEGFWLRKYDCEKRPSMSDGRFAWEEHNARREQARNDAEITRRCLENSDYARLQGLDRAQAIVDQFTAKMQEKLGFAVAGMVSIEAIHARRAGPTLSALLKVKMSDGASFSVENEIVSSHSPYGVPFHRFPTTFHDVALPGQGVVAMASEEEMNALFGQNRVLTETTASIAARAKGRAKGR